MSEKVQSPKEKSKALNTNKIILPLRNHVYTVVAAFIGVAMGVAGSVGFLTSAIHSQMAADTAALRNQLTSIRAAGYTYGLSSASNPLTCVEPSTTTAAAVTTSITPPSTQPTMPPTPQTTTTPPSTPSTPQTFIHKIISGVLNKQVANLSNTGPNSYNKIEQSNTVTTSVSNTNDVNLVNNNSQSTSSGSSKVIENTTGGTASTGAATNNSNTRFDLSISN